MKRNLNQQLGSRYVKEMYVGAYFRVEDNIHRVRDVVEDSITTDKLPLFDDTERWTREYVSADILEDFTSFQHPPLGYRQGVAGKFGNVVAYVTARRSALRGLRMDQLAFTSPPIYQMLYPDELYSTMSQAQRCRSLFAPEYTLFSVGISRLLSGDHAGFAVSNNVAVAMSCSGASDRLGDVLFRGKIVGHVFVSGELQIINKIMHRDSMKSLLST